MTSIFKSISLIIAGFVVFLVVLSIYISTLFQPLSTEPQTTTFVIPKGQAISIIGQRLQEAGLIKNAYVFRYVVKRDGLENQIQAGSFEIAHNLGVSEVAKVLTKGTNDVWITIVEGWRKEEIADMLSRQDLPEFDKEEFLSLAKSDEGYLFPETYLVPKLATSEMIYELLIGTFEKKVAVGLEDKIKSSKLSLSEIVTMASIVEREAKGDEQMKMVAGILFNRMKIGMPLQVDASLQYIKGYNKAQDSWWSTPLAADKQLESPYNTYQNSGLPPGPIANPGLDAIKAVVDPTFSDYLYYIHDLKGQIHYALTLDEHNQNVEKYLR